MAVVWNNVPVAYIDPNFVEQLDKLKDQSKRIYISTLVGDDSDGNCVTSQRKWQIPTPNTWDLNLFNISGISGAFDRATANQVYIRALTKGPKVGLLDKAPEGEGRVADCQAMKIQIDYMATMERAFRLRHASSIRCKLHSAARRRGHSTWNDAIGADAVLLDLGDGVIPTAADIAGPVGGIFTTLIRHLLLVISGGYNEGVVDIQRPETVIQTLADGTVKAEE